MANAIVDTTFKLSGWHYRLKAIGTCIVGLIIAIFGLYSSFTAQVTLGLIFLFIGIIVFIGGMLYWFKAKRLFEHKIY